MCLKIVDLPLKVHTKVKILIALDLIPFYFIIQPVLAHINIHDIADNSFVGYMKEFYEF